MGLKREKPHWGARKIRELLVRRLASEIKVPARSTIHAVLDRNGLVGRLGRRRNRAEGTALSSGANPNDLWCTDFKGEFTLGNKRYCYPLTVSDHASRYLRMCEALESTREDTAFEAFEQLFRERGLAAIRRGIDALTGADAIRPVQVTTSPAFAVMWLMSRIVDFRQQHPGITLLLNPASEMVELKPGSIDLAIRYREGRGPETRVDPVLIADMVVVGTPELIGEQALTDPAMLVDMPWLQELGTNEVAHWMQRHGVTPARPLIIAHMPGNLIMEAVQRGDGIAYTARPFVEKEFQSGQLVELFSDGAFGTYYIQPRPGVLSPSAKVFAMWLKQQATSQASVHS